MNWAEMSGYLIAMFTAGFFAGGAVTFLAVCVWMRSWG